MVSRAQVKNPYTRPLLYALIFSPIIEPFSIVPSPMTLVVYEHYLSWVLVCGCCYCLVTKSCWTLFDPMDCSLPCSAVLGISQARILEWVAISFFRASSWPRDQTYISGIGRLILYHWATREVCLHVGNWYKAWGSSFYFSSLILFILSCWILGIQLWIKPYPCPQGLHGPVRFGNSHACNG